MRAHDGQRSGEAGEDRTFVPSSGSVPDTQLGEVKPQVAVKQREFLLQYVNEVELEHSEHFSKFAPPEVEEAMRETIKSLLGSLPADSEQYMLIEDLYKQVEKLQQNIEMNMSNKLKIEFMEGQINKLLTDVEQLKDKNREIVYKNGNGQ